jgi:hypothetical protein
MLAYDKLQAKNKRLRKEKEYLFERIDKQNREFYYTSSARYWHKLRQVLEEKTFERVDEEKGFMTRYEMERKHIYTKNWVSTND